MLSRLRQAFWLFIAAAFGYTLGSGPFAEWVVDVVHMINVNWQAARAAHGPNGTFPLLAAGYLIGQGTYLLLRRLIAGIGPQQARKTERLAAWDPSLHLARRFGIQRYLEHCEKWAAEDPTTRTQSLALFKIRGIGALNDEMGSALATQLLQRVAVELRLASLPDSASRLEHWFVRYLPRPSVSTGRGQPCPRYPARWSGSTFALAFRELDAIQAISITRDLAAWIRSELTSIQARCDLSLSAVIAVGNASVTPRALAVAAVESLATGDSSLITVVHDPTDLRGESIAQMNEVAHRTRELDRGEALASLGSPDNSPVRANIARWLRTWGPGLGCYAATFALLQITGSNVPVTTAYFTWPDNLDEIQAVTSTGSRKIRLMRAAMPSQSAGGWTLSDAQLTQGNPADGALTVCQLHLGITNSTGHKYYVSTFDFSALDAKGHRLTISPLQMLRYPSGIAGRWLDSGETWEGWLIFIRHDAPITGLIFEPDKFTHIELSTNK